MADDTTLQVHLTAEEADRVNQLAAASGLPAEEIARRQIAGVTVDAFVLTGVAAFHRLRPELADVDALIDPAA